MIEVPSAYCTACGRVARVSEQFAFYGRDRQRMTLACGHVVNRPTQGMPFS